MDRTCHDDFGATDPAAKHPKRRGLRAAAAEARPRHGPAGLPRARVAAEAADFARGVGPLVVFWYTGIPSTVQR